MTNEEQAIEYIKGYRELDENLHNISPKDSVSYYATDKCLKYWDMAIQALSQEPTYYPPCIDCNKKMDEIRRAYDKLKEQQTCDKCRYKRTSICGNCKEYDEFEQQPCTDAVSRQAVLDLPRIKTHNEWGNIIKESVDVESVRQLPSVNPQKSETVTEFADRCRECGARYGKLLEQKSGKWIHFAQSDDCSECGYSTGKYGSPSKYCPNCGAKMESEDKE